MTTREKTLYPLTVLAALCVALGGIAAPVAAQATIEEAEERVADPFFQQTSFSFTKTLYVAANEPGANNRNNGRFPTYRGGLDGPFKDFGASALVKALGAGTGLRVYVRAGTYGVPAGGLKVRGGGTATTPVMLAGFPGDERPVLDGRECLPPATIQAIAEGAPYTPRVEALLKLDGRYGIVQDLQLQCGFRHNILARGKHLIIRRNILRGAYEDSIKSIRDADFGLIAENDVAGFASQAVDHFGAHHWLITRNVFHDPAPNPVSGYDGNAITVKGSARNVVITRNLVHHFMTTPYQGAITFGAPSDLDSLLYDGDGNVLPGALEGVAMGNTVEQFTGVAFSVQSCDACTVAENRVDRTLGLIGIGISNDTRDSSPDAGVLPHSTRTVVRDNVTRFAEVNCSEPIVFDQSCFALWVVNSLDATDLVMTENQYYSGTMPAFVYDWLWYSLSELQDWMGIEWGSAVVPLAEWP